MTSQTAGSRTGLTACPRLECPQHAWRPGQVHGTSMQWLKSRFPAWQGRPECVEHASVLAVAKLRDFDDLAQ